MGRRRKALQASPKDMVSPLSEAIADLNVTSQDSSSNASCEVTFFDLYDRPEKPLRAIPENFMSPPGDGDECLKITSRDFSRNSSCEETSLDL